MSSGTTLVLADGTAMLYRGFYAIPGLSTSAGRPTNAVFGFIRMMEQLLRDWRPSHAVVVFDGGIPPERRTLLPGYKANRKPMPDALRSQFPMAESYLAAAGICSERMDGEEADDVMATLVARAHGTFEHVFVATSDKDLFQTVDDVVRIVPQSGSPVAMGPDEVREKTGVSPAQIPDWLTLLGDTSDNIPGVPGVGAKTAARLLSEFADLDGLLAGLDRLPAGKIRSAIEGARVQISVNRRLVTLRRDLPCSLSPGDAALRARNSSALLKLFEEWEFHSMAKSVAQQTLGL